MYKKREMTAMRQTLIVSNRGQLTLPAHVRKRFGIKNGGPIIMEERDNELVLKPAMVLEVEMYTDEQVLAWDQADRLDEAERQTLLRRLAARK
jgi:AbrB family looped-hinge helix DNA binding protein